MCLQILAFLAVSEIWLSAENVCICVKKWNCSWSTTSWSWLSIILLPPWNKTHVPGESVGGNSSLFSPLHRQWRFAGLDNVRDVCLMPQFQYSLSRWLHSCTNTDEINVLYPDHKKTKTLQSSGRVRIFRSAENSWPVSFTVSAWEWVYATNLSRLERKISKWHMGETHSVLTAVILLPQRLSCYWGKIVSLRMLTNLRHADLRLTTAQQRITGQNLPSDLYESCCLDSRTHEGVTERINLFLRSHR
jgi:hypothetical protein